MGFTPRPSAPRARPTRSARRRLAVDCVLDYGACKRTPPRRKRVDRPRHRPQCPDGTGQLDICGGCGTVIEASEPYPFRCPRSGDDGDHVLRRVLDASRLSFSLEDSEPNPFVRWRGLFHAYHLATASGMSDGPMSSRARPRRRGGQGRRSRVCRHAVPAGQGWPPPRDECLHLGEGRDGRRRGFAQGPAHVRAPHPSRGGQVARHDRGPAPAACDRQLRQCRLAAAVVAAAGRGGCSCSCRPTPSPPCSTGSGRSGPRSRFAHAPRVSPVIRRITA